MGQGYTPLQKSEIRSTACNFPTSPLLYCEQTRFDRSIDRIRNQAGHDLQRMRARNRAGLRALESHAYQL